MSQEVDPRIKCPNQNNVVCSFREQTLELYGQGNGEYVEAPVADTDEATDFEKLEIILAMHSCEAQGAICHEAIGGCPVGLPRSEKTGRVGRLALNN